MQLSPDIRIQMKEHLWMWLVWAALTMVPCVLICLGYETIGLAFTILLLSIPFLTTMKGQIVMLVLALPFEYQGIDLGFANIGIFDTAVLFFLIGLFLRVQMQDRFHLEREGIFIAAAAMLVSFLPSLINTSAFGVSFKELIRFSMDIIVVYGLYLYTRRSMDRKFSIAMLKLFVVESTFLATYGIYRSYTSSSLIKLVMGRVAFEFFGDPNYYASYLILAFAIALGFALSEKTSRGKLLYGVCTTLLTIGIILTVSRAGTLSMIIVFCCFFLFAIVQMKGIRRITTVVTVILALTCAVALLLSPVGRNAVDLFSVASRLQSGFTSRDGSFVERSKILSIALKVIGDHPLVGVGFGAFNESFNNYRGGLVDIGSARAVHNTPVRILAETGIVGFAASLAFACTLFVFLRRAFTRETERRYKTIIFGLSMAMLGYGITSLTLDQLLESHFWIILGLSAGFISLGRENIHRDHRT